MLKRFRVNVFSLGFSNKLILLLKRNLSWQWREIESRTFMFSSCFLPRWRNWQTRRIQNPLTVRSCGFKSHPGYKYYSWWLLLILPWYSDTNLLSFSGRYSAQVSFQVHAVATSEDSSVWLGETITDWLAKDLSCCRFTFLLFGRNWIITPPD